MLVAAYRMPPVTVKIALEPGCDTEVYMFSVRRSDKNPDAAFSTYFRSVFIEASTLAQSSNLQQEILKMLNTYRKY
jgi:hypothetical protein